MLFEGINTLHTPRNRFDTKHLVVFPAWGHFWSRPELQPRPKRKTPSVKTMDENKGSNSIPVWMCSVINHQTTSWTSKNEFFLCQICLGEAELLWSDKQKWIFSRHRQASTMTCSFNSHHQTTPVSSPDGWLSSDLSVSEEHAGTTALTVKV